MSSTRRSFLAGSGATALAALAAPARAAPSPGAPLPLTPQVTEGPFYFDPGLVRSDLTEGRTGVPLVLAIRVVDAEGRPLAGSRVDVWHCDASGRYSGYDGQGPERLSTRGRTFLRGTMPAGDDGTATFRTIYPGWYEGRTTHIHFKVFDGKQVVLTSQLFLPDALSEYLFTNVAAYRRQALRDTLNRRDGIALEAGPAAFGNVREDDDRYVLTATAVVDPSARPAPERRPGPPPRDRPGPAGDAVNVRPGFRFGNEGGGARGAGGLGVSNAGPRGRPPGAADGPPPGAGPRQEPLHGDARVAAIVPGSPTP